MRPGWGHFSLFSADGIRTLVGIPGDQCDVYPTLLQRLERCAMSGGIQC